MDGYKGQEKRGVQQKKQDQHFPEILNRIWRWRAWAVTHIYLYTEVYDGPTLISEW